MEIRVQPHPQANGSDEKRNTRSKALRHGAGLCVLVLASIIPFASRAVYIDEPQYLHVAKAALQRDWRFPQDTTWVFFGKLYPNLAAQTHLPVVEYYLALLLRLTGRFDEVLFRLSFSVFPLLAVLSFYSLARRFTSEPFLVAALFAVSPAFFVLSPTLMMDIPMLAFLLAGAAVYMAAIESRRRLWLASICFILAAGTAYTALIPIGCLLIWAVASARPKREWLMIAAAPVAIAAWLMIMRLHFGRSPTNELVGYYTSHFSFTQILLPMFSFLGGVSVFPWLYPAFVRTLRTLHVMALSVAVALLLTVLGVWPSVSYRLWFVILASSGIGLLLLFFYNAAGDVSWRKRPRGYGFLLLWLPSTLLFFLLFAEMISARYILLMLPPLLLVVFERIERREAIVVIAATAALSLALSVADYRLVTSYPRWAAETIPPLQRQGFRVWNAAESGLRFYLEKEGIATLEGDDVRPRGGDLVIRQESFRYGLSSDLTSLLVTVRRDDILDRYPLRTFSRDAHAGFHDSHFGLVPFALSRAPQDHVELAEVSPFLDHLPQAIPEDFSSVPVWFPGGVLLKQIQPQMTFRLHVPREANVKYELEGKGSVVLSSEGIVLKKENPGPAIWKNFRIVPKAWE